MYIRQTDFQELGSKSAFQAPEAEFLMQTTWHEVIFLAVEGVWLKGRNSTTITWLKEDAKCVCEREALARDTIQSSNRGSLEYCAKQQQSSQDKSKRKHEDLRSDT